MQKKCKTVTITDTVKSAISTVPLIFKNPEKWYRQIRDKAGTDPRGIMKAIVRQGWKYLKFDNYYRKKAKSFLDYYLSIGQPVILSAEDGTHWIALVGIVNGKYVMIDSAGDENNRIQQYTFEKLVGISWYETRCHCKGHGAKNVWAKDIVIML
jgi:hypothetical protein